MILDFPEHVARLRDASNGVSVADVLADRSPPDFLDALDELVKLSFARRTVHIDYVSGPRIAAGLPVPNSWMALRGYCARHFGSELEIYIAEHLFEALLCVLRPPEVRAWIGPEILLELDPTLDFDDDGLLVGPRGHLELRKEGILSGNHLIHYSGIPGGGATGALLEDLLGIVNALGERVAYLGFSVNRDAVLGVEHYVGYETAEYIRGPRGISLEKLRDARFPEDPSGTITEHRRIGDNPLYQLFPLDRLEVMWSSRDGTKTVQLEELVAPDSFRARSEAGVSTRYLHARWDPASERFVHLDGAWKLYAPETYALRLQTDMRKFSGKASSYQKVFRIDAPLEFTDWGRLTAKFFKENELALEYVEDLAAGRAALATA